MIQREPDGADSWRASLRSTGVLRYFTAAFLGGWLCAWAFGEYFAFTLIASAVRAWLGPDVLSGWLPGGVGKLPPPAHLNVPRCSVDSTSRSEIAVSSFGSQLTSRLSL